MRSPSVVVARALAAAAFFAFLPAAHAEHFLWEVRSMTGSAYLFGTVHAGKKEWFPLPAPIERFSVFSMS